MVGMFYNPHTSSGGRNCSPCRRRRRRFRGWSPGLLIFLFSLAILALERLDVGQVQVRIATFLVAFERLAISNLGGPDVSLVFGGPAQSDLDVSLLRGVIRSLRPSLLQPKWGSGEAGSNDPQPGKQETIPTARILRASLEI